MNAINEFKELNSITNLSAVSTMALAEGFKDLSAAQILSKVSTIGLTDAQKFELIKMYATDAELYNSIALTNALSVSQQAATGTTLGFGTAMKGLGVTLLNFAKTPMGVFTIISTLIGGIYYGIKKHNQKIEEAKQKIRELGEEAKNTFSELKSSLESTTTSANEIKKEYAELAQGVKNLGKATQSQGRLSNEEYERFLELGDELSELFPEISTGVDSNGHSINNLSGDITTITSAIDGLVESQKKFVSQEMKDKLGDIWGSYSQDVADASHNWNEAQKSIRSATEQQERFNQIINSKDKKGSFYGVDSYGTANIAKAFKDAGYNDIGGFIKNNQYDFSSLTDEDIKAINDAFNKMIGEYQQTVNSSQNIIESSNREFGDYLIDSLQGDYLYEGLGDAGKQVANAMLRNFEFDTDLASLRGAENWDEAYEKIKEEVLDKISGLEGEDKAQFNEAWNNLLSIDTDAALAENIPKIEAYIKQIAELLNIDWQQLAPMLGYDIEAYNQELRTAKDRFATNETRTYGSGDHQYTRKTQVDNEIADKWLNELNEDDIAFIVTIDQVDIDETAKFKTEKEFQEWLEKLKNEAGVIEVRTSLDTATDLKTSDEAFQKLGSGESGLYADTKSGKQGSASDIEGLTESFKDVSGGLALESFADTLEKLPGDARAAQEAFDDLTTAYLNQSNILDDINEANKDYIIEQLKTQGIENAEAFVLSRIDKQVKENIKSINKYSKAVAEYGKKLLTIQKDDEGYDEALDGMRSNFEELYNSINDFKDANGDSITIPISTEFAEQNLEDLIGLANGSTDSLERLQLAAAKEYVTHIGVDLPTDQYNAVQQKMSSLMDEIQSQVQDIEVGATIDDTSAINSLNNLILAAGGTAEDVNNALSQMGIELGDIEYEEIHTPMSMTVKNGPDSTMQTTIDHVTKVVKSINYKKKATSGVGAHYTGSKTNNTNQGGGNGGGQQQDSEEMFDWIEVGIKRCEEELARFERKAGNIYDNWANRNKAVKDSIASITKEIKYQTKAAQEYKKSANDINLADMYLSKTKSFVFDADNAKNSSIKKKIQSAVTKKDIDPSVYTKDGKQDKNLKKQVEEYWDLWNKYSQVNKNKTKIPEEYIKKIQQGALKIETIKDETLRDALKKYQELWDKGIAAEDAAAQLRIDKLAKYEQLFKNTQSNYESLISLTDTGVKMADAKLQNLEIRGYFAQDSYYYDQKALKEKERKYLTDERDKLIKQLNQAEKNGVDKTSEAYINMQIAIENVKTEIQETTNDIQELNKSIRELKWEKFDYIQETIDKLHDENDFLVEVMNQKKLVDDKGNFTAQGTATIGLHAVDYDVYMKQAQDYKNELYGKGGIYDQLKNDENNKTLIARRDELLQKQRESIRAAYAERDAIKSLVEQGINNHLSSLQRLIDEYKNAQSEAKNLYDYQKNISKITKNIQDYEKILSAYQNDNSEESRKIIQETTVKLEEERENLKQTEWDHYIQETEKFLDDMYSEYEEILTSYLDDIDKLMQDMIDATNNNSEAINKTIHDECTSIGYSRSTEMQKLFGNNGLSTNNLVTGFTNGIENGASHVVNAINGLKETVKTMMDYNPHKDTSSNGSNGSSGGQNSGGTGSNTSSNKTNSTTSKKSDTQKWIETYGAQTVTLKKGTVIYTNQTGNKSKTTLSKDDTATLTKIVDKERGYKVEYIDNKKKKHVGWITPSSIKDYTWSTLKSINGYKTGGRNIKDEYAWTQEDGAEIIRTKDGAILTPVKGSTVFSNDMTQELWNFAKDPYKYIGNVALNPTITNKTNGNNTISNNNKIEIILPNVKDYNSLKTELQKDKKFTSFIQSVTVGEMMNQSTLLKNKY